MYLHDAIMAFGRSITAIDNGLWTRRTIGSRSHRMCAVGHVTHQVVGNACYLDMSPERFRPTVTLMADALRRTLTREKYEEVLSALAQRELCVPHITQQAYAEARRLLTNGYENETPSLRELQTLITHVNDWTMTREEVRQWFSDALDLLAEQLPMPLEPVVPAYDAELALV
jgi:hypothetical protein